MEKESKRKAVPKVKTLSTLDASKTIFGDEIPQGAQISPQVQIYGKVTDEIYSTEDIELKTELNDRQVLAFASATVFADKFDIPILHDIVNRISVYAVSNKRQGRKEFADISKASLGMAREDDGTGIPERLLGRRGR